MKESKYKYQVAHWLEELGRAMGIFKLSGGCQLPVSRTNELVSNYLSARKSHFRVLLVQYGSVVLFKTTITAALLFLGSILVIRNQISIGQFVAAEIIVLLIMSSVEKLILGMDNIYDVLTALEKIGYVTDLPLEKDGGLSFEEINTTEGISVELDNVGFQYADAAKPTLEHVSLKIANGERVCIAGYNGSGKSTLIKILEGLYANFEGMVTFNGVPLRSLKLESLRKNIGSLNTRDEIFNGSILENITLGNTDVGLKAIIKLARQIDLHDFINTLPKAYHTELLAGGINVPLSVRTKIMLVRTFIAQPNLLVLENFMPNIKRAEQATIIDFLTNRSKKWTLVAISNNPDFAAQCDRVIILKNGQVVANGAFHQIKSSIYAQDIFKSTVNYA